MISPDPLMRFPAQRSYALAAVAGRLSVLFGDGAQGERPPAGGSVPSGASTGQGQSGNVPRGNAVPAASQCPKCGIALVIRTGPRGKFYGCSNFPKYRETAQVG